MLSPLRAVPRSAGETPMVPRAHDAPDLESVLSDPLRLTAVQATELLDSAREEQFDRLTRLAARFLHVPSAFFSLVDRDRDFYKAAVGFPEPLATTRELRGRTFCHYTVQGTRPLVIDDTAAHPVYREVPTVRTLGVAAYLGVPLVVDGQAIGALCVIDIVPRAWTRQEIDALTDLAAVVLDGIRLRAETRSHAEARVALERANRELERAVQAAEAANRAKADFLAHMSHELRTPLNSIIGFANVLVRRTTETFGARERTYAERVVANGQFLLEQVNRILDLSKIDRGTVDVQRSAVRVSDLARSVCDNLVPQAAAARVTLELPAARASRDDQALLETDEGKLRQILTNLVGNAIKFTPAGGHVRVAVLYHPITGAPQRIDVEDTGIGIPADAQQRVFDAFEQAASDTAARYGGTGLGLSISRGLCHALGFRLTLESAVGVGSTFSVHLAPPTAPIA